MVDTVTNASSSKNSYTSWKNVTPKHQAFIDAILASKCHIIATMRAKQEYALVEKNGKKMPEKIGLAPIQREGMDYEFTLVFDLPGGGNFMASSSKDRTGFFSGKIFPIDETLCSGILGWLNSGQETKAVKTDEEIVKDITTRMDAIVEKEALTAALNWSLAKYKDSPEIIREVTAYYKNLMQKFEKMDDEQDIPV